MYAVVFATKTIDHGGTKQSLRWIVLCAFLFFSLFLSKLLIWTIEFCGDKKNRAAFFSRYLMSVLFTGIFLTFNHIVISSDLLGLTNSAFYPQDIFQRIWLHITSICFWLEIVNDITCTQITSWSYFITVIYSINILF